MEKFDSFEKETDEKMEEIRKMLDSAKSTLK